MKCAANGEMRMAPTLQSWIDQMEIQGADQIMFPNDGWPTRRGISQWIEEIASGGRVEGPRATLISQLKWWLDWDGKPSHHPFSVGETVVPPEWPPLDVVRRWLEVLDPQGKRPKL